ncbi:protein phosphatase 1A-like [Gadus macrocephalus]|uniref:protein phosphatase 1A-like n=1 Tax=Gadus macrocephalus TaxID=80720 RepID=UPI0028CB2077|nr:protein phosphatase 1A-like [Gadus macrocephalus]
MSVVLVSLPGAPKVTEEALKKEEDLDKYLESRVEELLGRFGDEGVPDLVSVLRSIATETVPNLPPGGGLASKRSVIEAMYNRLNPYREEEGVWGIYMTAKPVITDICT